MTPRQPNPSLAELFSHWEKHSWNASSINLTEDKERWENLSSFVRDELETILFRFLLGEFSVTATRLGPLAKAAPTHEAHLFLCTQVSDEAKHAYFFLRYLQTVERSQAKPAEFLEESWKAAPASFSRYFDEELGRITQIVDKNPQDLGAWYAALVSYHLVAEGVLAFTFLRSVREILLRLGALPGLLNAIRNIARDESRHVAFGAAAIKDGVGGGYAEPIGETILATVPLAVTFLVNPERRDKVSLIPAASAARGANLRMHWTQAQKGLVSRLRYLELEALTPSVKRAWARAESSALDEYENLHGVKHPCRVAGNL